MNYRQTRTMLLSLVVATNIFLVHLQALQIITARFSGIYNMPCEFHHWAMSGSPQHVDTRVQNRPITMR